MPDESVPVSAPPDAIGALAAPPASFQTIFRELPPQSAPPASQFDRLRDVELDVQIELGRTRMKIEDVLALCDGSVIELDRLAGDPVDVYVSDRLVARGEVVVVNDKFAIRLTEVATRVRDDDKAT